jgi:hypothetical protein
MASVIPLGRRKFMLLTCEFETVSMYTEVDSLAFSPSGINMKPLLHGSRKTT